MSEAVLHIGDIVTLFSEGKVSSFLQSLGLVDDRCVVTPDDGSLEDPPKKFRDCLFRICPINRYSAQKQYWSIEKRRDSDGIMLHRLKIAAEKEREQNRLESERCQGKLLQYGCLVQLQHVMSNRYLVIRREAARREKQALRVLLDVRGDEGAWLSIQPHYKLRTTGDNIVLGDRIRLVPVWAASRPESMPHQLHASKEELGEGLHAYEVNCFTENCCWKINLFLDHHEAVSNCLKSGDVIRLFHAEQERFMTMDDYKNIPWVYLRKTQRDRALDALNPKALWEIEVVQPDPCRGALAQYNCMFRFKHLASGFYLAAEIDFEEMEREAERIKEELAARGPHHSHSQEPPKPPPKKYQLVAVPHSHNEPSTLFELESTTVAGAEHQVPRWSYFRLKHVITGCWVQSTNVKIDQELGSKAIMYKLGCKEKKEDREAFAALPVGVDEVRDLDFANDAQKHLADFKEHLMKQKAIMTTQRERRSISELLDLLICFVAGNERDEVSDDNLLTLVPKHQGRDRQKLLREQNVLEEVFAIMKALTDQQVLKEVKAEEWQKLLQRCNALLRLSQYDYRKNQEYIADQFGLLQSQIGLGVLAEETITAIMNGNTNLLKTYIKPANIQSFVQLLIKHRHPKFLDYLSNLCTSRGEAIALIQEMICHEVLNPLIQNVLIHTVDNEIDGVKQICLIWNICAGQSTQRPLLELAGSSAPNDMAMLDFYEHQLNLLAEMCRGRQYKAIRSEMLGEMSIPLILRCIRESRLPYALRAAFARLMLHAQVDCEPQQPISFTRFARLWNEVPNPDDVAKEANVGRGEFKDTVHFVEEYLRGVKAVGFSDPAQNQLTHQIVLLARSLVMFGFYTLTELRILCRDLLDLLDCFNRPVVPDSLHAAMQMALPSLIAMGAHLAGDNLNLNLQRSTEPGPYQTDLVVMDTKLAIIEILQFLMNLRLDYRITKLLVAFKVGQQVDDVSTPEMGAKLVDLAEKLLQSDWEQGKGSIDGNGGTQVLRVLIHLLLHPHPPLVSASLQLLFRCFAQRQELCTALKQVQLLVSEEDVECYRKIHQHLLVLKSLVETSELWINRSTALRSSSASVDSPFERRNTPTDQEEYDVCSIFDEPLDSENVQLLLSSRVNPHETLGKILDELKQQCYRGGSNGSQVDPRRQQLLRNMRVHEVILELLAVPYDKDNKYVLDLMASAHEFLQSFCHQNKDNQMLLHARLAYGNQASIPQQLRVDTPDEALTATAVFRDNLELCSNVCENFVRHVFQCLDSQRHAAFLLLLQTLTKCGDQIIPRAQTMVMDELSRLAASMSSDETLPLFNEPALFQQMKELMKLPETPDNMSHPLYYHLQLIRLMSLCTEGKNGETELLVASLLTLDDLCRVICYEKTPAAVKEVYLLLLVHCYVDTDVEMLRDQQVVHRIWQVLDTLLVDIRALANRSCSDQLELERLVAGPVCDLITLFFTRFTVDEQLSADFQSQQMLLSQLVSALKALQVQGSSNEISMQSRYLLANSYQAIMNVAARRGMTLAISEDVDVASNPMLTCSAAARLGKKWQFSSKTTTEIRGLVDTLQEVVNYVEIEMHSFICAEMSVLVAILHHPTLLYPPNSRPQQLQDQAALLSKLVNHCEYLLEENQEQLLLKVLHVLRLVVVETKDAEHFDKSAASNALYQRLMQVYLNNGGENPKKYTQAEVQWRLDAAGSSNLVVKLIISSSSPRIFAQTIQLAKALLDGGNMQVQSSFNRELKPDSVSEKFFKVLVEKMQLAESKLRTQTAGRGTQHSQKTLKNASFSESAAIKRTSDAFTVNSEPNLTLARSSPLLLDLYSKSNNLTSELSQALPGEVSVIEPVLRFLQLLCENHNKQLQNFLRNQGSKTNYNMVTEGLQFLDVLCGSTSGTLGLLGLYINEYNYSLVNQTLITLTEFCQGPCHENQNCVASQEANGLDMIIALVMNDIHPLAENSPKLALSIKDNAATLLLAIMESRRDSENAERILNNIKRMSGGVEQLISTIQSTYALSTKPEVGEDGQGTGHKLYLLAHQLACHDRDLFLRLEAKRKNCISLRTFAEHTAQIEIVRAEGNMEQVVFPVPEVCNYLTSETKWQVFTKSQTDQKGSKITDFVSKFEDMYQEMLWQKNLRNHAFLYWYAQRIGWWSLASYTLAIVLNLVAAVFYPFEQANTAWISSNSTFFVLLITMLAASFMEFSIFFGYRWRKMAIAVLIIMVDIRMIPFIGVQNMMALLGLAHLGLKALHCISRIGSSGIRGCFDRAPILLVLQLICSLVGLTIHPLFYSLLLLELVEREETLRSVINSVTKNWRSIALTTAFGMILVYIFAIVGFLLFREDFVFDSDGNPEAETSSCAFSGVEFSGTERHCLAEEKQAVVNLCTSLWGCLVETVYCGLRSGGGIGECLRRRGPQEPLWGFRAAYDLLFFFLLIIIVLNLIFGVIIDTFGELRNEKQQQEDLLRNTCFICGLQRGVFDNQVTNFEEHCQTEHCCWNYVYFLVYLRQKGETEYTGPESYVAQQLARKSLDWFPRMRAMSLSVQSGESEEQQELRQLRQVLESTLGQVQQLNDQLTSLQHQVAIQRNRRQRMQLIQTHSHFG